MPLTHGSRWLSAARWGRLQHGGRSCRLHANSQRSCLLLLLGSCHGVAGLVRGSSDSLHQLRCGHHRRRRLHSDGHALRLRRCCGRSKAQRILHRLRMCRHLLLLLLLLGGSHSQVLLVLGNLLRHLLLGSSVHQLLLLQLHSRGLQLLMLQLHLGHRSLLLQVLLRGYRLLELLLLLLQLLRGGSKLLLCRRHRRRLLLHRRPLLHRLLLGLGLLQHSQLLLQLRRLHSCRRLLQSRGVGGGGGQSHGATGRQRGGWPQGGGRWKRGWQHLRLLHHGWQRRRSWCHHRLLLHQHLDCGAISQLGRNHCGCGGRRGRRGHGMRRRGQHRLLQLLLRCLLHRRGGISGSGGK